VFGPQLPDRYASSSVVTPRRSLLLAACFSLIALGGVGAGSVPAGAQVDPTIPPTTALSFGGGNSSTTVAVPSTTEAAPETTQTLSGGGTSETRLLTESRKVLATIVALVFVAIALAMLTVRYWRVTKPVAPVEAALVEPPAPLPLGGGRRSRRAVAGADHARADADWLPRGTGEHEVVEVPSTLGPARPGRAARAAALGRPADA